MKHAQTTRVIILLLYAFLLFGVCRYLFGAWLPPSTEKGLWMYASLANLLLGTLLLSPYFTKPADAVSDAVVAALVMPGIHSAITSLGNPWLLRAWRAILAYYVLVIVVGTVAMLTRTARSPRGKQLAESTYIISTRLGDTAVVFSLLFLFALLAFHRDSPRELLVLAVTWIVLVPANLLEHTAELGQKLSSVWYSPITYNTVG